ncbi:Rrf2 family transcriptional regulator [Orrella marina]|uniref:Rrf2 family transcriptional regulator n=1 Tax=Orrella marina TaxID=2163011 RepID=UPI001D13207E|nr:Rrf2 family transcriptional regulator [Orrella marina]
MQLMQATQEIRTGGIQQMVVLQIFVIHQLIDCAQSCLRPIAHRKCDSAIELHDWRRVDFQEDVIKTSDLRLIGILGQPRFSMIHSDCRLQGFLCQIEIAVQKSNQSREYPTGFLKIDCSDALFNRNLVHVSLTLIDRALVNIHSIRPYRKRQQKRADDEPTEAARFVHSKPSYLPYCHTRFQHWDGVVSNVNSNTQVVRRTMGYLRKAGIVTSDRGYGVGWCIHVDLGLITVFQ